MLPRLLLDTKNCQKWAQQHKTALAEGRSPPQELEVGPRSRPYLLVMFEKGEKNYAKNTRCKMKHALCIVPCGTCNASAIACSAIEHSALMLLQEAHVVIMHT